MGNTGVYANGYLIPSSPIIYDAAITGGGSEGVSMSSLSRSRMGGMIIEKRNRKIGASITTYDAELLSILTGEFI